MPLGLQGAYGAMSLQEVLRQHMLDRIAEEERKRKGNLDEREQALREQTAQQMAEFHKEQMRQLADQRAGQASSLRQTIADKIEPNIEIGQRAEPMASEALRAAGRGNLLKPVPATPGGGMIESLSPDLKSGVSVQQPPLPAGDIYLGNEKQRGAQEQKILRGRLLANPELSDFNRIQMQAEEAGLKAPTREPAGSKTLYQVGPAGTYTSAEDALGKPAYHAPKEAPTVVVQTVDDQGNQVTKIVPKTAGSTFKRGPNATTANRLTSAKAVNQTGDDIIAQLQDPAVKDKVGVLMGRANTFRDFIGNPPPEFSELAGAIESYALANMGVHGMRSVQGAEDIKKLLDKKHTPESLAATIRGISKFSKHLLENEGQGGASSAPSATPTAPNRIRYDINGNRIP